MQCWSEIARDQGKTLSISGKTLMINSPRALATLEKARTFRNWGTPIRNLASKKELAFVEQWFTSVRAYVRFHSIKNLALSVSHNFLGSIGCWSNCSIQHVKAQMEGGNYAWESAVYLKNKSTIVDGKVSHPISMTNQNTTDGRYS